MRKIKTNDNIGISQGVPSPDYKLKIQTEMKDIKLIHWDDLSETLQRRVMDRWQVELVQRYKAMGFGEPRPFEIERDKTLRLHYTVFLQSGHIYYESTPIKL